MKLITILGYLLFSLLADAQVEKKQIDELEKFKLKNIIQMDDFFSPHVIVVEKATHRLFVYQNQQGKPKLIAQFETATGEVPGDKIKEGDKKTPEGVYQLTRFFSSEQLFKMYGDYAKTYGAGAFELNYPNPIDKRLGKTGSGIWLHSTDDENRIAKGLDSRGCIVVNDQNLKNISQYINLSSQTPIIVTQNLDFWSEQTWSKAKNQLNEFIENWRNSWEKMDLEKYLGHYHPKLFRDHRNRGIQHWRSHKKGVFQNAKDVKIQLDHISIFISGKSAVINLMQNYHSNLVSDTGKKTLYLMQDEKYQWKIIGEVWSKINHQIADLQPQNYFN